MRLNVLQFGARHASLHRQGARLRQRKRDVDDEGLHPGHKSIRLRDHDYSAPALYFVTICAHERRSLFGRVAKGRVEPTALGVIAREMWVRIPTHFANANLHEFVIMPNHMHGIIEIACRVGAQHAAPLQSGTSAQGTRRVVEKGSLSPIVRSFKAAVTLKARRELGWTEEIWQRNYFESVLRDGQEVVGASRYIGENPMKWEWDQENPEARTTKVRGEIAGAQHAAPLQR